MKAKIIQPEPMLSVFERMLKTARMAAVKAQKDEYFVFQALEVMGINAKEIPTDAPNANNLEEAVSCFLQYGEYSVAEILKEVRIAREKSKLPQKSGDYKQRERPLTPAEEQRARLTEAELARLNREISLGQIDFEKLADPKLDSNIGLPADFPNRLTDVLKGVSE